MPTFPRTKVPRHATIPEVPGPLMSIGETGGAQLRSIGAVGRVWEETWPDLKARDPDVEALLSFIEDSYTRGVIFDIVHQALPGSGLPPNGAGGGTPLVAGAGQSGTTLNTDGWTGSVTNVVRAGDVIRIAGLNPLYRITADANSDGGGAAALTISPSIPSGSSPGDNAAITRTGCTLRAFVLGAPTMPRGRAGVWLRGLKVRFMEAV